MAHRCGLKRPVAAVSVPDRSLRPGTLEAPPMIGPMRRTSAVLAAGMRSMLHVGAQLFVSVDGTAKADFATGLSAPGKPMTAESMMTWLSCSKIATSILFARIWEEGLVDLDDPVAAHLPEFAGGGKDDAITIRHVWTHTCGLLNVEEQLFPVRYDQSHQQTSRSFAPAKPIRTQGLARAPAIRRAWSPSCWRKSSSASAGAISASSSATRCSCRSA